MDDLQIRPATASDRADLLRGVIALQSYEAGLHDTRLSAGLCAEPYLAWMMERVEQEDGCCFLAYRDGAFAGFVAGWIERVDNVTETADSNVSGYISDICVLPEWRGQGLAQRLLTAAEGFFRTKPVRRLRIGSLAGNEAALKAYATAGFRPYEVTLEKAL